MSRFLCLALLSLLAACSSSGGYVRVTLRPDSHAVVLVTGKRPYFTARNLGPGTVELRMVPGEGEAIETTLRRDATMRRRVVGPLRLWLTTDSLGASIRVDLKDMDSIATDLSPDVQPPVE
jgi:hypothetical protein